MAARPLLLTFPIILDAAAPEAAASSGRPARPEMDLQERRAAAVAAVARYARPAAPVRHGMEGLAAPVVMA